MLLQSFNFWIIPIIANLAANVFASPLQYCHVRQDTGTDQCLALSSYFNTSSDSNDFYLHISAKFEDRNGFAAFGTGVAMDGSLMFVIYPGDNVQDVTVSLRTTTYHNPPAHSERTPDYQVLSTWVNGSYYNAQLVCYGCDQWTPNPAKVTSEDQGWIFSTNHEHVMQTSDLSKPLAIHTDYAAFELDMTISHYSDTEPQPALLVENGRQSVGAQKPIAWSRQQLFAIHGALLSFAFTIMMPLGLVGIRSGHGRAFTVHWIIQISSALIAIVAIMAGIRLSLEGPIQIASIFGIHQFIGFVILLCVGLTPGLGYLHHLKYLEVRRGTALTRWHRRMGAFTMCASWINIFLGLYMAGQPLRYFVFQSILMAVSALAIVLAPRLRPSLDRGQDIGKQKYKAVDDGESYEDS